MKHSIMPQHYGYCAGCGSYGALLDYESLTAAVSGVKQSGTAAKEQLAASYQAQNMRTQHFILFGAGVFVGLFVLGLFGGFDG